jgi:hypothetical protein
LTSLTSSSQRYLDVLSTRRHSRSVNERRAASNMKACHNPNSNGEEHHE